ncbi:MAG TPA: dipeptide/oligopeptide/nickel ABC transporter ATP-binding protein [Spirochaetia bacterium]|nr:dipeptide/oligopeptide/nickel ABC transporter ATP-binding protein [Spirochaetia bacterium]
MPLVEARGLCFRYPGARRRGDHSWTLEGLDLQIEKGSAVGIVGESGSGKSTLVRVLCGLMVHQQGDVKFDGRDINDWLRSGSKEIRWRNQIVFQNPRRSLDPRMSIRQSISEPVRALERRRPSDAEIGGWLARVGLNGEVLGRYPHQLSGGQLQRVGVARALSVKPDILYADEPTSALDVSVQAQVLNLLMDIRAQLGLTLVMVSHDLAVISRTCETVVVMKGGRIVEAGTMTGILSRSTNPYTNSLVQAARNVSLKARSRNEPEHQ